jgi:hypothetical protein
MQDKTTKMLRTTTITSIKQGFNAIIPRHGPYEFVLKLGITGT